MSNKKHVLGFTPNGKLFALVDDQGILRIWDTETNELKQEFTPNLHLAGPCTALTWLVVVDALHSSPGKKTKSPKSAEATKQSLYIALGTSKGNVSLYSYAEGKIVLSLKGESHSGRVTAIAYDNADTLYTTGGDCQVIVWSLQKLKRVTAWQVGPEKPESIAYLSHSNSLVIGARQIKVYSISDHELLQTFTGHSSEINAMCSFIVNKNLEYALTTSQMERIICLWKIGKKGRNKTAACSLLMEDVAHCLTCEIQNDEMLRVASVTRSGVIHIYLIPINSLTSEKPVKPKTTLEIASDSTKVIEPIAAIAAHFQYNVNRPQEIIFGYGSKRVLTFERLSPNFNEKMNVLVRADPKKLYATKEKSNAANAIALKTVTPVIRQNDVEYQSPLPLSSKKLKNEVPMESRLQNLNLSGPSVIQSQSKVQLLFQALHSKDADLLRSVLCTKDEKTVQLTLQRLPVQYVSTLVNELTLLMEQKRTNIDYALIWLKTLTQTHSSQLLAMGDDLLNKFAPCLGIIEYRANCLKEVSKLSGRINLLVSSIKRSAESDVLQEDNVLVYEDKDDSTEALDQSIFGFKDTLNDNWSEDDGNEDNLDTLKFTEEQDINSNDELNDDDSENSNESMELDD